MQFELRGDAFKIVTNERRPIPKRSGSSKLIFRVVHKAKRLIAALVGPWLDVLSFITWAVRYLSVEISGLANKDLFGRPPSRTRPCATCT